LETLLRHRDDSGGLFIGTSKLLLALMNSAPAELLHPLIYAALQPHLVTSLFFANHRRASTVTEVHATRLNERSCSRNQKKRRQQSRRRNTLSEKPTGFSGKTLPCPTLSGSAAKTVESDSVVYCPLNFVIAFRFFRLLSVRLIDVDLATAVVSSLTSLR
jgi:hypothetical protein